MGAGEVLGGGEVLDQVLDDESGGRGRTRCALTWAKAGGQVVCRHPSILALSFRLWADAGRRVGDSR